MVGRWYGIIFQTNWHQTRTTKRRSRRHGKKRWLPSISASKNGVRITFGMPPNIVVKSTNETKRGAKTGAETNHGTKIRPATEESQFVINVEKKDTYRALVHSDTEEDTEINNRHWEYTEGEVCKIKFALKQNIDFWEKCLKPSSFVLNVLRHGYLLPLTQTPPPFFAENNKSALKYPGFVGQAIEDLLANNFIQELAEPAYCCNPLTVADKGKLRLVLDLRHVNEYIILKRFKYEDLKIVAELFEENDYFVRFDLTSGYHHIDIHPEHHKFLGFHWTFLGGTRYFQFTVLAFGLASAGQVFTKNLRPLTKRWRSRGIKSVIFLDDGIAALRTKELAGDAGRDIEEDLSRAGFAINKEKSDFTPKQRGKWLGVIIDTTTMTFHVPEEKIEKLKKSIISALNQNVVTPKELARLAGSLSAMHSAIGPLVRLFTRSMYHQISDAASWYQPLQLGPKATDELKFWLNNISHVNGFTFKPRPTTACMMFTDASNDGYGGFMVHRLEEQICCGSFTEYEKQLSSTFRELLAVKFALKSYGGILRNQAIQVNIDNFSATRILTIGSAKDHLQRLAVEIFQYCLVNNIKLTPQWVPREKNFDADFYSKVKDTDAWTIDQECFDHINKCFGPFSVDRFADDRNRKLERFNSRYYCPGTSHVNSFTADWRNENNWLCYP